MIARSQSGKGKFAEGNASPPRECGRVWAKFTRVHARARAPAAAYNVSDKTRQEKDSSIAKASDPVSVLLPKLMKDNDAHRRFMTSIITSILSDKENVIR